MVVLAEAGRHVPMAGPPVAEMVMRSVIVPVAEIVVGEMMTVIVVMAKMVEVVAVEVVAVEAAAEKSVMAA
jgi:hypothetical protein